MLFKEFGQLKLMSIIFEKHISLYSQKQNYFICNKILSIAKFRPMLKIINANKINQIILRIRKM